MSWFDEDGDPTSEAPYATEWYRFTDYEDFPQPEIITANQGQMYMVTGAGPTDQTVFQGFPRITMPQSLIKFRWYQVPFSYIESLNSYIKKYIGYVNQNDFYGWPAGSLLYQGYNAPKYTPPVPEIEPGYGGTTFSTAKLCDIEFTWLFTQREPEYVPTLTNENWIPYGHNCQPWFSTRKFYYVKSNAAGQAIFPSFPFELLFTDPDI